MRNKIIAALLALNTQALLAGEFTGNVSGYIGNKDLDKDDWSGYEEQSESGIISDFKMQSWPVSIAVDIFVSADSDDTSNNDSDSIDVDAVTSELHIGLRKIWEIEGSRFSPYVGVGAAYVTGYREQTLNAEKTDTDDSDIGTWMGIGIYWRPVTHLNIGIDVRYSKAQVNLFDQELEAGGLHSGVTIGYHW